MDNRGLLNRFRSAVKKEFPDYKVPSEKVGNLSDSPDPRFAREEDEYSSYIEKTLNDEKVPETNSIGEALSKTANEDVIERLSSVSGKDNISLDKSDMAAVIKQLSTQYNIQRVGNSIKVIDKKTGRQSRKISLDFGGSFYDKDSPNKVFVGHNAYVYGGENYASRTTKNVNDSDLTLIFSEDLNSRGTVKTINEAKKAGKNYKVFHIGDKSFNGSLDSDVVKVSYSDLTGVNRQSLVFWPNHPDQALIKEFQRMATSKKLTPEQMERNMTIISKLNGFEGTFADRLGQYIRAENPSRVNFAGNELGNLSELKKRGFTK